jgi:hypothetical protein
MFIIGRRKRIMKLIEDPINREIRQLKFDNRLLEKEIKGIHLSI